jgi:hypothetical protein
VIYYISDQLMNMINIVKYLLNVRRMWYFPLKNNREEELFTTPVQCI